MFCDGMWRTGSGRESARGDESGMKARGESVSANEPGPSRARCAGNVLRFGTLNQFRRGRRSSVGRAADS
jgi:hypothetical protein